MTIYLFSITSAIGNYDGRSQPGEPTTVNTTEAVVAAVLGIDSPTVIITAAVVGAVLIGVIITLVTVIVVIERRKR